MRVCFLGPSTESQVLAPFSELHHQDLTPRAAGPGPGKDHDRPSGNFFDDQDQDLFIRDYDTQDRIFPDLLQSCMQTASTLKYV